ncbi:MAG: DUF1461 domain-containing protein [Candidatus Woesearchaeota archaeon]
MEKIKLFRVIFCISLPFFLLLFSYHSTMLFYPKTEAQKETISFVNGGRENMSINYTSSEISHLQDVRGVMKGERYLFIAVYLAVILLFGASMKNKVFSNKLLRYGGITTAIIMGIILLFFLISFNEVFTLFHQLFFPQGNWMFAPDSLLIQTFPLNFFTNIGIIIFIQTLILASFLIGLSFLLKDGHVNPKD